MKRVLKVGDTMGQWDTYFSELKQVFSLPLRAAGSCILRDVPQVRLEGDYMLPSLDYIGLNGHRWPNRVCIIVQTSPQADIGIVKLSGHGLLVWHNKSTKGRVVTRKHTPVGNKLSNPLRQKTWHKVYELTPDAAWYCVYEMVPTALAALATLETSYATMEEYIPAYCALWPEGEGVVIDTIQEMESYSIAICKHDGKFWLIKQDHN